MTSSLSQLWPNNNRTLILAQPSLLIKLLLYLYIIILDGMYLERACYICYLLQGFRKLSANLQTVLRGNIHTECWSNISDLIWHCYLGLILHVRRQLLSIQGKPSQEIAYRIFFDKKKVQKRDGHSKSRTVYANTKIYIP